MPNKVKDVGAVSPCTCSIIKMMLHNIGFVYSRHESCYMSLILEIMCGVYLEWSFGNDHFNPYFVVI